MVFILGRMTQVQEKKKNEVSYMKCLVGFCRTSQLLVEMVRVSLARDSFFFSFYKVLAVKGDYT